MTRCLALLALGCAGCHLASLDSFLYAPLKAPPGGYTLSTDVIPGFDAVSIKTPDGETLDAAYIHSSGAHPDLTIIYCHGQANNIESSWTRVEKLYPLGYNIEVFDPRGFGKSTGTPSESGLDVDVRAVQAELSARTGLEPDHLVYYGHSLGSALCTEMAVAAPPAVLVTESAFASVDELARDGSYADLPGGFVAQSRWDNLAKIAHIASPYLALHGLADDYVNSKYSVELADAHRGVTELVLVPGANHGSVPTTLGPAGYQAAVEGFITANRP